MRIPKVLFLSIFVFICLLLAGKVSGVSAYDGTIINKFLIELPDGSTQELKGVQLLTPTINWADDFQLYHSCMYYGFDGGADGYHCWSKSSCIGKAWIMPYLPGEFNSVLDFPGGDNYSNTGIYECGWRCYANKPDDPGQRDCNFISCSHKSFYGITFTERFPWFPYEEGNPRGASNAYWSANIDSECDESTCPGYSFISPNGYFPMDLQDTCCNPRKLITYGINDKPSWAGDDIGEVVVDRLSENQWHLAVTWTLKLGNVPPVSTVIGPNDCHVNTDTFTVNVSDPDFDTVKEIELTINDGSIPYTYSFNLETGVFTEPAGSPFEIESPTLPSEGASVTVSLKVTNLEALGYQQLRNFSYQARARDENDWGNWSDLQSFNEEWYYPTPVTTASPDYEYQTVNVTFADGGAKPNGCLWSASSNSHNDIINNDWPNIRNDTNLPALGTGQCSGNYSFSPASDDNYTFYLIGDGGLCVADVTVNTPIVYEAPDAWLMTGWGDVYAYDGISNGESMKVWKIMDNRFSIPTLNDWAYFSTYIISKSDAGGLFPISAGDGDGKSKRGYKLDKYVDYNTEKIGTGKVYDYLMELAGRNECPDSVCKYNEQPGGCNGFGIYFIDNGNLNISTNFNEASEGNACIFIVKDNVLVSSGVTELEAFFLVDGAFTTESANQRLEIDGGVISSDVNFNRALENNFTNPSETINYNPKYLDLLRDYLGEGYPSKIREYKYSSEQ